MVIPPGTQELQCLWKLERTVWQEKPGDEDSGFNLRPNRAVKVSVHPLQNEDQLLAAGIDGYCVNEVRCSGTTENTSEKC